MKRYSWKYMAGLADGEGCIDMQASVDKRDGTLYCRPRFRMCLSGKAGEEMIPMFIANFGGNVDHRKREFQNPNWQPAYSWCLTNRTDMRKFLQNVVNHTFIKKEQIKFSLWWLDNIWGKHVTQEVKRFGINELKAMKLDPHRLSDRAVTEIEKLMPLMR